MQWLAMIDDSDVIPNRCNSGIPLSYVLRAF
jgi:hypothetical protein